MPDSDALHDYRPDPVWTIASHLDPKVESSTDESGIPEWARKFQGVLDGYHEEFITLAQLPNVKIREPKLYKERNPDEPAWDELDREKQLAIIMSLGWQDLVDELIAYVEETGKKFNSRKVHELKPDTDDYPEVRPYVAMLYQLVPDYFAQKDYWLEKKPIHRSDRADIPRLDKPQSDAFGALVAFRNFYLNGMFARLRKSGAQIVHKMVGSVELTSDYDVTFSGPDDVPAAVEYYRAFRQAWGVESATLFDANLYVRDWMTVIDLSMPPSEGAFKTDADKQKANEADPSLQLEVLEPIGDIYGLVKIRRYTDRREWNALVDAIKRGVQVDGLENPTCPDLAGTDMEHYQSEPSQIPRFARLDMVDEVFRAQYVKPLLRRTKDIYERFKDHPKHGQHLKPPEDGDEETLERLMELDGDGVLRAMANAYLELMAKLRGLEGRIRQAKPGNFIWRQNQGAKLVDKDTGMSLDGFIEFTEKGSLLLSEAVLFANEAYFTQGALWSVVGGQAGAKPENLTVDHYLQSFNEQVGDALKELKDHLREIEAAAEEEAGNENKEQKRLRAAARETPTGFYRASKYEGRMAVEVDAMVQAFKADPFVERRKKVYEKLFPGKRTPDAIDNGLLQKESVMDKVYDKYVQQLLAIRKASGEWAEKTAEEKEAEAKKIMNEAVNDQQFKQLATDPARKIAEPIYGVTHGNEPIKYSPDGSGDEWNLRHLIHHLLWHCAVVNKMFRKIRSRGPFDLYVVNLAKAK